MWAFILEVIVGKKIRLYTSGRKADLNAFDKFRKFVHKSYTTPYTFEIIDVLSNPTVAKQEGIVVTPTIIYRISQRSFKKVIGNISDPENIALLLGIS